MIRFLLIWFLTLGIVYAAYSPLTVTDGVTTVTDSRKLTFSGSTVGGNAQSTTITTTSAPGGSDTQVQYNNGGVLSGAPLFVFTESTGNVGIGTATPMSIFHSVSTSTASPRGVIQDQVTTDALGARMNFRKARGTPSVPTTIVTGDVLGRVESWGYDGSNYLAMGQISFNSIGTIAATRVPTTMSFSTATNATPSVLTTAMTIDSAQFVGIGTTTPTQSLQVIGPITTSGGYILEGSPSGPVASGAGTSANTRYIGTGVSTTNWYHNVPVGGTIRFNIGEVEKFRVDTAAVRISGDLANSNTGTTVINERVTDVENQNTYLKSNVGLAADTNGGGYLQLQSTTSAGGAVSDGIISLVAFGQGSNTDANSIAFYTRSGSSTTARRMIIDTAGNVVIGSGVPINSTAKLHVVGTGAYSIVDNATATTSFFAINTATAGTVNLNWSDSGNLIFNSQPYANRGTATGGSARMTLTAGGNLGIGVVPTSLLHVQQFADSTNVATPVGLSVDSVGAAGELTASSGTQIFAAIKPTYNQTSTAAGTDLLINRTNTAIGSGAQKLIDAQVGGTSRFLVTQNGDITMGLSGVANIKDTGSNTRLGWGTITNSYNALGGAAANINHQFGSISQTQSSGVGTGVNIAFTVNQTSTAGFTDLQINRTNTAAGSGTQRLIDAQVGSTTQFNVTRNGDIAFNGNGSVLDDQWIGLGAAAGRIEFDDQATDEVNFQNARVGIGTTTPSSLLSVVSTTANDTIASLTDSTDGISVVLFGNTNAGTSARIRLDVQNDTNKYSIGTGSNASGYGRAFYIAESSIGLPTVPPFLISSGSNVGINDLTPDARLDVNGTTANTVPMRIQGFTAQTSDLVQISNGTATVLTINNGGQMVTAARNEATGAGSALLGTNSPAVTNTAPYTWIKMKTSDGSTVYIPAWK